MQRLTVVALCTLLLPAALCGPTPEAAPADPCDNDPDQDRDGVDALACGGLDCDDTNALRAPGRLEVCDGTDDDCDPSTFGERDADADGAIDAACFNVDINGVTAAGDDCNDGNATVRPGAVEVCDGLDNDCDGSFDEGVAASFFPDADADGHGDALGEPAQACSAPAGYSYRGDDCDDEDAGRNPGAPEVCDDIDNDCDTEVDEGVLLTLYVDDDGDGFGTTETEAACADGPGLASRGGDCDDGNAALVLGSLRCTDTTHVAMCDEGTWGAPTACSQGCVSQPNGTGFCR